MKNFDIFIVMFVTQRKRAVYDQYGTLQKYLFIHIELIYSGLSGREMYLLRLSTRKGNNNNNLLKPLSTKITKERVMLIQFW